MALREAVRWPPQCRGLGWMRPCARHCHPLLPFPALALPLAVWYSSNSSSSSSNNNNYSSSNHSNNIINKILARFSHYPHSPHYPHYPHYPPSPPSPHFPHSPPSSSRAPITIHHTTLILKPACIPLRWICRRPPTTTPRRTTTPLPMTTP